MNTDCIFCKIVSNDAPSYPVYEDEKFLAFMDIRPLAPGQVMVIPKTHYRYVWDVPEKDFGQYFEVVQKLAKALQGTFGTDMVYSRIMGEEVFHAHVWLFPSAEHATGNKEDLEGNAEKIKQKLA